MFLPLSDTIDYDALTETPDTTDADDALLFAPVSPRCRFEKTSLVLPADLRFEEWKVIGETLKTMKQSVHFWLGDWVRFGKHQYGEKYAQAIDATGYNIGTLQNDVFVAGAIESSRRREVLSFDHHAAVASFPPAQQTELLDRIEAERLTTAETRVLTGRVKAEQQANYAGQVYRVRLRRVKLIGNEPALNVPVGSATPSVDEAFEMLRAAMARENTTLEPGDITTIELTRIEATGEVALLREITLRYPR